ncbi:MAG TPA: flagellar motor switch phosphatase FliY [Anaerovoracaceae bacterium]|nr:flagellar motor switch phosphatase FliY [Anaerovoracaceae bacterium]
MTANLDSIVNLSDMDKDIIGEVMNISMGAAATAMSTILDKKVSITTPRLETTEVEGYGFSDLEPALGVIIKYIDGIGGLNMLLIRTEDFKKILAHLLGIETDEMTEFDEISVSAIGEIMNQMMGAAASALATFLGVQINISPPEILDTTDQRVVQERYSDKGENIIEIKFDITIEDLVKSEFVSIMDPQLAREIIRMSLGENEVEQEVEIEQKVEVKQEVKVKQEAEVKQEAVVDVVEPIVVEPIKDPVYHQPKPQIQVTPYAYTQLGGEGSASEEHKGGNLDLIMSVPVQITVELGKTKRKIKDIAEFAPGNIVELDRQAGDQVDIMANGRLIAKGDVVVVDDNYSVRITEIMKARDNLAEIK